MKNKFDSSAAYIYKEINSNFIENTANLCQINNNLHDVKGKIICKTVKYFNKHCTVILLDSGYYGAENRMAKNKKKIF